MFKWSLYITNHTARHKHFFILIVKSWIIKVKVKYLLISNLTNCLHFVMNLMKSGSVWNSRRFDGAGFFSKYITKDNYIFPPQTCLEHCYYY